MPLKRKFCFRGVLHLLSGVSSRCENGNFEGFFLRILEKSALEWYNTGIDTGGKIVIREYAVGEESYLEVETGEWKGRMILSVGSILLELTEKKTGLNLLRSPETIEDLKFQPEVYGFPVLIPPNCIHKGLFSWRGRNYHLPVNNPFGNHIHGVVLNRKWHLADSGEENGAVWVESSYTYNEENEMFEGFPHEFRVDLRYTFLPDRVLQRLTVTNIGPETMPLGVGFHSTFRFPLGDRSPEAYRSSSVRVTTADFYWKFDRENRFAITGEKARWNRYDDFRHGKIINREPVSKQCPVAEDWIDGKSFRGAILDFPVPRIKVVYRWDEKFGQAALWNREGMEDFFCAEPMSWMADSPNLPLPESVTGLYPLEPGEVWSAENTISVERY